MADFRISRTIDDFWKLSTTYPRPEFWPHEGDSEIKSIRDTITQWVENDPLLMLRQAASDKLPRSERSSAQQLLFSRNPVLCGLMAFHLNTRMQTIGQLLVDQWYDVQQLAFLYNLVQTVPGSKLHWPDMELFIKIHGEHKIFVGSRPKDAAQSLDRLELATGISSPVRFAKNSRGKDDSYLGFHKPDRVFGRRLEPTSTKAINLFRNRYEHYTPAEAPARSIHSAEIGKFLDELSAELSGPGVSTKSIKGKHLRQPRELLSRKWRNMHQVGGLQLLALMKDKLFEEEPILMFDYLGMHKRAVEILRLIKAKEDHKLIQYFTSQYMRSEAFIANLVILIHHVARGSALAGQEIGLATEVSASASKASSRMVHSCGEVMRSYLGKHGEAAIKDLKTFCKNKKGLRTMVEVQPEIDSPAADDGKFMYWFCLDEVLGPMEMESLKTGIPLA